MQIFLYYGCSCCRCYRSCCLCDVLVDVDDAADVVVASAVAAGVVFQLLAVVVVVVVVVAGTSGLEAVE